MRFKYYLRGAGVGILVTTIVLTIAFWRFKPTLTADEIRLQARKLGMVEAEEADKQQEETEKKEDSKEDKPTEPEENQEKPEDEKSENEKSEDEKEKKEESEKESDKKEDSKKDETTGKEDKKDDSEKEDKEKEPRKIRFVVSGGEFSDVICEHLKEKGLIKNAERYNRWLGRHGYDNMIQPGVYRIKEGSTYKEIAEILSEH
ncbi:MAG: endolytic transglycosylase MltG [Lachnospiraceae bacterium]|nr:endolytic transglycosylase MltG [Lachnospiraceae bacterium]